LCNINKEQKISCTSKIAGVVAGVAKYDSLNRVATTATGVMFYRGGMY
jgi:phage shock protein PspC (stress-responsive transcriptional regulator)